VRLSAAPFADLAAASAHGGWVFFDRDLIDALDALQYLTGEPALATISQEHRFHHRVFLAPPWPEIYVTDPERRHGFDAAVAEYRRLLEVYPSRARWCSNSRKGRRSALAWLAGPIGG
jgi:predicted ATPase